MSEIQARLFGGFELNDGDGVELRLGTRKARALFSFLIVEADRWHTRDRLAGLLWSDRQQAQARHSLTQALGSIRKLGERAGVTLIESDFERVRLLAAAVNADALSFQERLEADPAEALEFYAGPLLDDFPPLDPTFDEWLATERAFFHEKASAAFWRASDQAEGRGDMSGAMAAAKRWVTLDPLAEHAHRRLIQLHIVGGDRAEAARQYQACERLLREELDVEPAAETKALLNDPQDPKRPGEIRATIQKTRPLSEAEPLSLPDRPSIAVLPFANLSGDPEQQYFADGMTEDIITALSRFRWFFVIARNSTFAYKGNAIDVTKVSRDLGVRYVLEGSVRRAGNRVRVSGQLIDGTTGNHIWAERYDRELTDIFEIQDEITAHIAAAVAPELYGAEGRRAERKRPTNLDAWDYFLRAYMHMYRGSKEENAKGLELAAKSIELDPNSAHGYKALAYSQYAAALNGWADSRGPLMAEVLEAAKTAVQLDDKDAEAHQILGMAYLAYRQHDLSISELETAVGLNPSFAHGFASLAMSLTYSGRPLEALSLYDKAIRLSPQDPNKSMWRCAQALAHLTAEQFEDAIQCAKLSIETKWSWLPSHRYLVASYGLLGMEREAEQALASLLALDPRFTIAKAMKANPFKYPADFQRLANGLRQAGLPEE